MPRSSAPRVVEVVLHAGSSKTGTSSLQRLMDANRDVLASRGVLYPRSPGLTRHTRLGLAVRPDDELVRFQAWRRQPETDPARFRRRFRQRLARELDVPGLSRLVLSDEALFGMSDAGLTTLGELARDLGGRTRVVVYLRRQDEHVVSRYQQEVKAGEARPLRAWMRGPGVLRMYDYHARLTALRDRVEPDALLVRRFAPERFVGGSLYHDFLDAADLPVRVEDLKPVDAANESLDAASVELLRLLNLDRIENEGLERSQIDSRDLVPLLVGRAGPTLSLPPAELDAFRDRWEASNRAVARDFVADGDPLFSAERSERATTIDQRLDPVQLDHLAAALDLPADQRARLLQLARRDA